MSAPIIRTGGEPDIAAVAALLADRSRARLLSALLDGRALPAGRLAAEAGVTPQTTSSHLGRLLEAGLVTVERSGRHRFYSLASAEVATALEALGRLAPEPPITSLRQGTGAQRLRDARTCYDHLAGRLGVRVTAHLVDIAVLRRTDGGDGVHRSHSDALSSPAHGSPYELGARAAEGLARWGVNLAALREHGRSRPVLRFCTDWTEQRYHLAGGLGAALLRSVRDQGWVEDGPRPRELVITRHGEEALADLLGASPA
ncbi:helix-turn-helix transcriptional regulator [Luteipulveratus sp. YIM 133132]|uniref:ArsR/SmtB family transcription factor n=1 Tax=Luteipulveratus flavus TaxID=3031728 RepID=UPI0023B1229D|nr:helix-turn-helix transcriptional regulator [Luteipulveratus sp. YIM 133132]MDE9367570.1 helix-turn-helix transcriptional regulator [Luteipulveratus sp. YIM 133132]